MSWPQTEDAIQAAIVAASGLPSTSVVWSYANVNAPVVPYARLTLSETEIIGQDAVVSDYSALRAAGSEIRLRVDGMREVMLQVETFAAPAGNPTLGDSSAAALAENIRTGLILPSVRALFAAQNVVPFDPLPIQKVPDIPNTTFRGRAVLPIRCYMPAPLVAEYTTYIQHVAGTITAGGVTVPWTGA